MMSHDALLWIVEIFKVIKCKVIIYYYLLSTVIYLLSTIIYYLSTIAGKKTVKHYLYATKAVMWDLTGSDTFAVMDFVTP